MAPDPSDLPSPAPSLNYAGKATPARWSKAAWLSAILAVLLLPLWGGINILLDRLDLISNGMPRLSLNGVVLLILASPLTVLGFVTRRRITRSQGNLRGASVALFGFLFGVLFLLLYAVVFCIFIARGE